MYRSRSSFITVLAGSLLLPVKPLLAQTSAASGEAPDQPGAVWAPANAANFQPANRPADRPVDIVVIHDIEGSAEGAVRWFQNPRSQVSAHYVVGGPDGRTVWQQVKERDIGWHAGNRDINSRSVGIEHEGFAYRPGFYSTALYEASARLVRDITNRHNIPRDRAHIIGHFEVPSARIPGNFGGSSGHTDPGPYWDWDYYMTLVRNDALLRTGGSSAPLLLHPGEQKELSLVLANTGDDPWPRPGGERSRESPIYLGATSASETALSPFYNAKWVSPRFASAALNAEPVAPGTEGQFNITLQAPRTLGPVTETFRVFKVPVAPHRPVPFGPLVPVTVIVSPWEIVQAASGEGFSAAGWTAKGTAYWRKAAPGAPAAEWKGALPIDGEWEVAVRVPPGGSGRSPKVVYEVQMADGPKSVTLEGSKIGGTWQRLGRFVFTGAKPIAVIRLLPAASAPGVVVAGEVRFMGPFPTATR